VPWWENERNVQSESRHRSIDGLDESGGGEEERKEPRIDGVDVVVKSAFVRV